jgi:hypothetical protein
MRFFSAFSHHIRIFALHHFFALFAFLHHVKKKIKFPVRKILHFSKSFYSMGSITFHYNWKKNWTELNQTVLKYNFPEKIAIK